MLYMITFAGMKAYVSKILTAIFLLVLPILLCAQVQQLVPKWRIITNLYCDQELSLSEFTFRNNGKIPVSAADWTLYFNFTRPVLVDSCSSDTRITHLGGDLYKMQPLPSFKPIAPGESRKVSIVSKHWLLMKSDFPRGAYFIEKGKIFPKNLEIEEPMLPAQTTANTYDHRQVETAEIRYEKNKHLSLLPVNQLPPFLPTPRQYSYLSGQFIIPSLVTIKADAGLGEETVYLKEFLTEAGIKSNLIPYSAAGKSTITLSLQPSLSLPSPEVPVYKLLVDPQKGVIISGSNPEAIFLGIQSLRSMMLKNRKYLPAVEINDSPRFQYRGLMLDVARNFQNKEAIFRLLDHMALYKLNKLHFHLTDDEGWRLEINGLPELTAYGAFRGHTDDEKDHLQPAYGSGPYAEMGKSDGCGFYNRTSFIEILQYAAKRHIEIIPEIDMPGHARAAIKAMDNRYRRYMAAGKPAEALEYLLRDTTDLSEYQSIQAYDDNVVCVCLPSLYKFMGKVILEISNMYKDAGLQLKTLHIGGDEVPEGVWEQSPVCRNFLLNHPEYSSFRSLEEYFAAKTNELLLLRNITTGGWEEIGFSKQKNQQGINPVNTGFNGRDMMLYCWNSVWGDGREDNSSVLANAGFKVVQANATNLYLDMAYTKIPLETGYYWANFISTETSFQFTPSHIPNCAILTKWGDSIQFQKFTDTFTPFTDKGLANLMGIEACLWGENIKGEKVMNHMLFPRLIAVAERAWTPRPVWEAGTSGILNSVDYLKDYNRFVNTLGQKELPMLKKMGIEFRQPLKGAKTIDGSVRYNIEYPGY